MSSRLSFTRSWGMLVLAIWLILWSLGVLLFLSVPQVLLGLIALIAGILILVGR